jgi:biopolymer transport protein ExbB
VSARHNQAARWITFFTLLILTAQASAAMAWWDEKWQYRKKIAIDTSETGAELKGNVSELPLLLRLHTGNFNFANAREDGSDLRFVNADDKEPLKYHIESFDAVDEMALVWVRIPRLAGGNSQQSIWMYYGNKSAPAAQDKGGVYDVNTLLVYHLGEAEGPPRDQTAYNNHAAEFAGVNGTPSLIGKGVALSGAGERIVLPKSSSLDLSKGFTFSTWIKIPAAQQDARLFSWQGEAEPQQAGKPPVQPESFIVAIDQMSLYVKAASSDGWSVTTEKTATLTPETWHFVAVAAEPAKKINVFLDGALAASAEISGALPNPPAEISIGSSLKGEFGLAGELDEIQISRGARNAAWARAVFISQGPTEGLIRPAEEEAGETGGLPVFYFKTIAKNISLDGWIIIGTLVLFGVATWVVFIRKTLVYWLMEKQNVAFTRAFIKEADPMALAEQGRKFPNSCLYNVYAAGCREFEAHATVSDNPGRKMLTDRSLRAFNAALDRAFVVENKNLNSYLILLTMAIAGGPFLGLLGTVWGVMNTFAAMAEAGEANLAAIAPGVASALATTVFGLIVAIPALFAYNYLVTRAKGLSLDLDTFVDEFSIKVETTYGGKG